MICIVSFCITPNNSGMDRSSAAVKQAFEIPYSSGLLTMSFLTRARGRNFKRFECLCISKIKEKWCFTNKGRISNKIPPYIFY